jgi:fluoride ion exporter CrcB/FEX
LTLRVLALMAGGALGALARARANARPGLFGLGTLVVDLSGAFALGVLTGLGVDGDALFVLGAGSLALRAAFG